MAPKQLDDIIESSCDRAWVEDKQAHFTQLHDSWSALCRYIREELDKGQGVVVPETVAFLFKNEQAGGKAKRVPDVLVLRSFLTEHNLQAAPGVGPDDAVSSLGSLYETYPPLHPVNYTTVAQMAGHSKKAVVDAVKHIMYELVYCTRSHVDVVLDFGVAVLKIKNMRVSVKYHKEFLVDLGKGDVLSTTKTFQAMIGPKRDAHSELLSTYWRE